MVPSEPLSPHRLFEQAEMRDRVRTALEMLPERERRIITLYYFEEATMKQIGAAIGVNESRVSQLHARPISRLKQALEGRLVVRPKVAVRRPQSRPRPEPRRIAAKTQLPSRRRLRQVA
jgi:DNA-directed RNA polymerase specialized sigma24 family protein